MRRGISGWGAANPTIQEADTPRVLLPLSQSCELYQPYEGFLPVRPNHVWLNQKEQKALIAYFHEQDQGMWDMYRNEELEFCIEYSIPIIEPYVESRTVVDTVFEYKPPEDRQPNEPLHRWKRVSREVLEEPDHFINRIKSRRWLLNRSDYRYRYQLLKNLTSDTAAVLTHLGFTREDNWGWEKDQPPNAKNPPE